MSYELLQQASEIYSSTPDLIEEMVLYFTGVGLILTGTVLSSIGIDEFRNSSEQGELEEDLTQPQ